MVPPLWRVGNLLAGPMIFTWEFWIYREEKWINKTLIPF